MSIVLEELDELRELRRQVSLAISIVEANLLIDMSAKEIQDHANRFGPGDFIVGDFVIRKLP